MSRSICSLLVLAGCSQRPAVEAPVPPLDDVAIQIDGVGIGAPCTPAVTPEEATPEATIDAADCGTPVVRLSLRSGTSPAKVRLVGVMVAGGGRTLTVASRAPTVWTSAGAYEPWNETIGPDEVMAIEYGLARVDWDHLGDPEHVHAVYVIVEVDGRERVFSAPSRDSHFIVDDTFALR